MRKFSFLVAAALALSLGPLASRLGPVFGSLVSVALALLLACAASGTLSALAMALGAAGAFGAGVLGTTSSAVAGACLVALVFAERTIRVRSHVARAAHLGVAAVGGALAGTLSSAYASSSLAVQGVSVLVGSVLMALPLLVDADDPIAYALERSATLLRDPSSRWLREGAALRRHADDALVDAETRRGVGRTWRALLKLAEARVRLEQMPAMRPPVHPGGVRVPMGLGGFAEATGAPRPASAAQAVVSMLDEKIEAHVAALTRAYTAVNTAHAAGIGLDDAAARGVDAVGETLEDVSRAIVDVKA
jgi:MFS family permease